MNYAFYINDYYWQKVVGEERFEKGIGRWCAHCTLEILGGASWYIVWNEPAENIRKNSLESLPSQTKGPVEPHN